MKNHPHEFHHNTSLIQPSAPLDHSAVSLASIKPSPYHRPATTALTLLSLLLAPLPGAPVLAQSITAAPDGTGTTVMQNGNQFTIQGGTTIDQNLFHSFQDFGLSASETAQFLSNPSIRNILTRVVSGNPSIINGLLSIIGGNSNLYLMNPAGIVFGPNAHLNVPADFLATTATGIEFANGTFHAYQNNTYADLVGSPQGFIFSDTDSGTVINAGQLQVNPGQHLGLVGKTVINTGQLSAPGGTIQIVGVPNSSRIRISQPNQLLSLEIDPNAATRPGHITALELPQLLTGPADLASIALNDDDRVQLNGSDLAVPVLPGLVALSGELDTQTTDAAQTPMIQVEGDRIALTAATLDASGTNGGQITIGTDANRVIVDQASTFRANTTAPEGNGGDILIWSNEATAFLGSLEARGGNQGGDGGFIEVSSRDNLAYNGQADLTAPHGEIGTLYLDPTKIFIVGAALAINDGELPSILQNNSPGSIFTLSDTALNAQSGTLLLEATDEIKIDSSANLNFLSPNVILRANSIISDAPLTGTAFTFEAQDKIELRALITAQNVKLSANGITINNQSGGVGINTGSLTIAANASAIKSPIEGTGLLSLSTFTMNQDISVGQNSGTPAWDLSTAEISQFQGFSSTQLGNPNSTGIIELVENPATVDFINRAPLTIVGAQELIGFNQDTNWLLQGTQQGRMSNAQVSFGFQNVQKIQGGTASDTFIFGNAVNFGGVLDGGTGKDTLDYSNYGNSAQVDLVNNSATGTLGVFQIEDFKMTDNVVSPRLSFPPLTQSIVRKSPKFSSSFDRFEARDLFDSQAQDETRGYDRTLIHNSILGDDLEAAIAALDQLYSAEFAEQLGIELPQRTLSVLEMQGILKTRSEATGINSAIIYAFVRPDQLDLLLVPPVGQPITYTVPVNQIELLETVQSLRLEIGDPVRRQTVSYRPDAEQLYQWLIAPLKADLKRFDIRSLVFSLDAGLRAVPMAALYDGNQFLIEQYNLSLVPSLSLTQTHYTNLQRSSVLAMGIADFQTQSDLPAVPAELAAIATASARSTTLFNDQVTLANWQQTQQNPVDIVHLATHAEFQAGHRENSYIQLWDQPLTLEAIEVIPWAQQRVNLLVLSACRTAFGSEEAEFGFAGLAVKTGVNSALASIWYANDLATLALMQGFYQQLTQMPTKAEALRQAQLALLNRNTVLQNGRLISETGSIELPPELSRFGDRTLSHPYYWSGFTLIGSPW